MNSLQNKKIAIVCDWLKDWGGAEQVLFDLLEVFPTATVYSSVFFPKNFPSLEGKVRTTFLDKIPFVRSRPKMVPFLRTYAFESLDLSEFDIVISSSSAESKGIITRPETRHFCYCHTPTRYYWSHSHEYQKNPEFGWLNPLAKILMPFIFHRMRLWDFAAAQRVDHFIANSGNTAGRIAKYYRRDAIVIPPGIDDSMYIIGPKIPEGEPVFGNLDSSQEVLKTINSGQYYLAVGRVIPYKKFDLLVDAFNKNGLPLVICTTTNTGYMQSLVKMSNANILWIQNASNTQKITLMQYAKGFLFPPEEDFGMTPIESMLCGTPVIAFGKGGALETVQEGYSGTFFEEQTSESLNNTIERFEIMRFSREQVRSYTKRMTKKNFQHQIYDFIRTNS